MKLYNQYNKNTCGPIALLNILKLLGKDVSYKKSIVKLIHDCQCDYSKGTNQHKLQCAMTANIIYFKIVVALSLKRLKKQISKGIILCYFKGHYFVLTAKNNQILGVNYYSHKTTTIMTDDMLQVIADSNGLNHITTWRILNKETTHEQRQ